MAHARLLYDWRDSVWFKTCRIIYIYIYIHTDFTEVHKVVNQDGHHAP